MIADNSSKSSSSKVFQKSSKDFIVLSFLFLLGPGTGLYIDYKGNRHKRQQKAPEVRKHQPGHVTSKPDLPDTGI